MYVSRSLGVKLWRRKCTTFNSSHFSTLQKHYSNVESPGFKQKVERLNPINIQMLSSELHKQIFRERENRLTDTTIDNILAHLKTHGLSEIETSKVADVNLTLPKLLGSNIADHFYVMADEMSREYRELLSDIAVCNLPLCPAVWKFNAGWTRYNSDGTTTPVPYPEDKAIVFDVEVCMSEGNYPTLAAAASSKHWYLWCSKRLVEDEFNWSQGVSRSDLIPLGSEMADSAASTEQLVIGHNVAFDRTFIAEEYLLQRNKCSYLDTMSLHICISGLTGLQRALSIANKKNPQPDKTEFPNMLPTMWADVSSLNNLADVYSLYCNGSVLEKSNREVFISGSMSEIKHKFQELATYCARDVEATHEILKKIVPLFFKRFPHPVTFAGLLEMSSVYLPVNSNWERYLRDTQDTFNDLQKELKLSLMHLANDACPLLHNNMYQNDPWLWDLDWSVQDLKFKKAVTPSKKKGKLKSQIVDEKLESINETKICDDIEEEEDFVPLSAKPSDTWENSSFKHILESASLLRKVRPFLPGYPAWYRELCDKNKEGKSDWEPGPSLISIQMRCVPKLLKLTWDGYPVHYDAKHGWGYIVPTASANGIIEDNGFPLKELLTLLSTNNANTNCENTEVDWTAINEPQEKREEKNRLWKDVLSNKHENAATSETDGQEHYGIGPHDIGILGCSFYRLPHKDGPHKRVGNPLSKDFLPKVEDGTLKSRGEGKADRALLLSKMLSYWKNSHQRIVSQMVVWLSEDELPKTVTMHESYDDSNTFGVILPRLIPAGTVTRRAVEATWLTASNAYPDRVGSELKSMVQAPPGYHFVGADVDSQELWIASILGDSHFGKMHGCTAFGWMTLQGKKNAGTDMHSKTANSVGINRNQAKVLNYARIYGAGKAFAQRLLMQFNHRLSPTEAKMKVKKMYAETKGIKRMYGNSNFDFEEDNIYGIFSQRKIWHGGSESHLFNKLEEIAISPEPRTPVLDCRISRALEPKAVDSNFMTSRVNWVVQSSAVDYLHLMLVSMRWLFKHYRIDGRLSICIHDEVRYLVNSQDCYRAALALQITNLWTRCLFAHKLGMNDLPQSVAFFSSVDIDKALRKEVDMDSATPSNPHGLENSYGIPTGESLDIYQVLEKTSGCLDGRKH